MVPSLRWYEGSNNSVSHSVRPKREPKFTKCRIVINVNDHLLATLLFLIHIQHLPTIGICILMKKIHFDKDSWKRNSLRAVIGKCL